MDDFDSFAANENQASTSHTPIENRSNGHTPSGITLVLPSLKAIKAAKVGKKSKPKNIAYAQVAEPKPKIPRPIKLKPLKEVLMKLITQIKKKDDYAFFINPVNPEQVPGYANVIKNPMDFGTMATKVNKGKYRSLEEFKNDFCLVTTNAKTFNPPGTIYYTEADRLETWGLEHIARASAHVIEYETDWNIEIENDDDGTPLNIDDEDGTVSTPRDVDGSMAAASPAPSSTPLPAHIPIKRGPRGPYKRHAPSGVSEGLDVEGRMPGSKDGIGAFPPGSDWAELMIALKIKGKRYRTKKERLRFEKEGPPYHPDGSLNYAEMEDPFSVLNVFVPDPPARPQLTPLYPPPPAGPSQPPLPMVVSLPPDRALPTLLTADSSSTAYSSKITHPLKKRRHWTIVRNASSRKQKDRDAENPDDEATPTWKVPREPAPADYGSFAAFLGALATETGTQVYSSQQRLFATIRSSVENRPIKRKLKTESTTHEEFWTDEKAAEGWDYVRNVVYGGVDGYAYVRSLAEFVKRPEGQDWLEDPLLDLGHRRPQGEEDRANGVNESALGVPLARYVEDHLVDTITRGLHGHLRDTFLPFSPFAHSSSSPTGANHSPCAPSPSTPVFPNPKLTALVARTTALPYAAQALAALRVLHAEQLDMAALVRSPEELAKESMLQGQVSEGGGSDSTGALAERDAVENALQWGVGAIEELMRHGRGCANGAGQGGTGKIKVEEEDAGDGGNMDMDTDTVEPSGTKTNTPNQTNGKGAGEPEDPLLYDLRMNLMALAKRAPLDKIARLPANLVPTNIRGLVPTV
ncbi:hypothetical protein F5I97DRAFT_1807801 [Phlebopus sp. FC_14]|nr:hypothetical protein F5I97DRAFT_1807801 [Phlebopus sp. FC_14]